LSYVDRLAFAESGLKAICLPSSVERIGMACFYRCLALRTVTFGINSGLLHMGDHAFRDCRNLPSIFLPPLVRSVGESCFLGCEVLRLVEIRSNFERLRIGDEAFEQCSSELGILLLPQNSGEEKI
jgi:hypothetical protein